MVVPLGKAMTPGFMPDPRSKFQERIKLPHMHILDAATTAGLVTSTVGQALGLRYRREINGAVPGRYISVQETGNGYV